MSARRNAFVVVAAFIPCSLQGAPPAKTPLPRLTPAGGGEAPTGWFVDASAPAAGNGTIQKPFRTLTEAWAAAASEKLSVSIHAAAGTYTENIGSSAELPRNRSYAFFGGYQAGAGFRARDPKVHETRVIAASPAAPVFRLLAAKSVTIDGFTITGGLSGVDISGWQSGRTAIVTNNKVINNGNTAAPVRGAGIRATGLKVTVSNNVIENNLGADRGAGLYVGRSAGDAGAAAEILKNVVRSNTAHGSGIHGAGIWMSMGGVVEDNVIDNNTMVSVDKSGPGGGLIVVGQDVHVQARRNLVTRNQAETSGGGLFVDEGASALFENNVVAFNRTKRAGAGIAIDGGYGATPARSSAIIVNCTIVLNGGSGPGGEGIWVSNSDVQVVNTLLWKNDDDDFYIGGAGVISVSHTNFTDPEPTRLTLGPGNRSVDPLLANPSSGDFALSPASPMIDVGTSKGAPAADFLGRSRPARAGFDLGALEAR